MFLKSLKLTQLEKNKKYDFVVPFGSTEQHGPFIPFGTDTYVTDAMIARMNQEFPELLILPTLEYSCSGEHEGFVGTVWLLESTFHLLMHDVCNSLKDYARSISFITGHGGNLRSIDLFVEKNKKQFNTQLYHLNFNDDVVNDKIVDLIGGPCDEHAGNSEISLLLSIHPELTIIPSEEYVKTPLENPWEKFRLIEKSVDGIADANPNWFVNKEFGGKVFEWLYEEIKKQIVEILKK